VPDRLHDHIRWSHHDLPGDAAVGTLSVRVGDVSGAGATDGPRATILAGQHGDEGPWGALAIAGLLRHARPALCGRLRIVPCANPLAAAADVRNAPLDHLDVNTVFPGQAGGSHTHRLAAVLAALVEDSDVVIDLHGGGSWCMNAFTYRFAGDEDLAAVAGAPFAVDIPPPAGGLLEHARRHGARILALEMGGRGSHEVAWCARITAGLERVLRLTGVMAFDMALDEVPLPVSVRETVVLRPSAGGVFVPSLGEPAIGTVVAEGTELGRVLDMHTMEVRETFTAPYAETALLLLRPHVGRIEGGAMTYVVGRPG
jgi:predicted deacylase